jgi:hypothetical protein
VLKRLGAAIALLVLCGTLYIDTPSHAAGLPTEKKVCPPGYELKTIKEAPSGKTVRLWFKKDKTKTVCVRVKEVHVGDKAASSRQDYCREGRIEGISQAEMDAGVLTINGDRWVRCGPGANSLHRISVDLDALARSLAVQLQLPDTTPIFGPDPNNNEWKMLTVGFPVWLTTQGPRHKATTASAQGLTFRLSADLQSTTFAMGDGSQVTCTAMTPFTASSKAGAPSPTCGHTYTKPSLPKGSYTVTATANWLIRWSVDGFSGSFPMSYSDSAQLAIGELQALNR